MSLIVRALVLSLRVLPWSLLTFPLLLVFWWIVGRGIMGLLRGFGFPLMVFVMAGTMLLPALIMIRIALSLLGEARPLPIGNLVKSGFLYGPVLAGFGIVLGLVGWLAFVAFLLSTGTSIHMLDLHYLVMASLSTPEAFITIQIIIVLIMGAFFAAIVVPMAGSASGDG